MPVSRCAHSASSAVAARPAARKPSERHTSPSEALSPLSEWHAEPAEPAKDLGEVNNVEVFEAENAYPDASADAYEEGAAVQGCALFTPAMAAAAAAIAAAPAAAAWAGMCMCMGMAAAWSVASGWASGWAATGVGGSLGGSSRSCRPSGRPVGLGDSCRWRRRRLVHCKRAPWVRWRWWWSTRKCKATEVGT